MSRAKCQRITLAPVRADPADPAAVFFKIISPRPGTSIPIDSKDNWEEVINKMPGKGGFPSSYLSKRADSSIRWLDFFIKSYLDKYDLQYQLY